MSGMPPRILLSGKYICKKPPTPGPDGEALKYNYFMLILYGGRLLYKINTLILYLTLNGILIKLIMCTCYGKTVIYLRTVPTNTKVFLCGL